MLMAEYVCIVCPNSCRLVVREEAGELNVSGNECKRGIAHGIHEHTSPKRMLTTTVCIAGAVLPRLPVVSEKEIPKARLGQCLEELYRLKITAPVRCGDVIVKDIGGTGVDMLASRTMMRKEG